MPVTSRWLEEKRIIYTQLIGQLSSQEALQMSATHESFLSSGVAPVHIVVDLTRMETIPTNLKQNMSMGDYLRHPNLGWTVLVGGNVLVNFMLSILSQVFQMKYTKRETVEEALAFLAEHDPTLHLETHA